MEIRYNTKVLEVHPTSLVVEFSRFEGSTHIMGVPRVPADKHPSEFFRTYAPIQTWIEELTVRAESVVGEIYNDLIVIRTPEPYVEPTVQTFPTILLTASEV